MLIERVVWWFLLILTTMLSRFSLRTKAFAPFQARVRASARVDLGSFLSRSFAESTIHVDGGPRRFDYKQRVLTTTKGGLVSRTRVYQKEGSSADGERSLTMDGTSKAKLRKAEKKQERLKRIADISENPEGVMEVKTVTKELVKCLKNRDFNSAVQLFRSHRDAFRYKHNIMTLLNVCYKHEHLETAKEIVDLLRKNHGTLVEQAYLALIRCHTAKDTPMDILTEQIVIAKGLVAEMESQNALEMKPRLRTYQPILAAVCRQGDLRHVLLLTRGMLEKGIEPKAEQLGMILTCAIHGGELQSDPALKADLRFTLNSISRSLLGVPIHTMHDYVAALCCISSQDSFDRGVMVEGRQDVPGEMLVDHLTSSGSGAGDTPREGIGRDMEGYAVAMNVFADNPLACYYGEGATTSSSGGSSDKKNMVSRGPRPGGPRGAGNNGSASGTTMKPEEYFEYQTIGQRVSQLVGNKADKERARLRNSPLSRREISMDNQAWNDMNAGHGGGGDRYPSPASAGKKKGGKGKKRNNEDSGGGSPSVSANSESAASADGLTDIPIYKDLFYSVPTAAQAVPYAQRYQQAKPVAIVEINKEHGRCPNCGGRLPKILLSEQEKEGVREELFSIANTTSKGQGSAIRAFGDWLDTKAKQGVEYTYIVDGANVAYHRQNFEGGKFNFRQVELVVEKLQSEMRLRKKAGAAAVKRGSCNGNGGGAEPEVGLPEGKILVLVPYPYAQKVVPNSSRHRKGRKIEYLSRQEQAILSRFENEGMLYVVPQGGNDDWFWVYATIHKLRRRHAFCVTNDLMRDHKTAFSKETPRAFERWRANTIIHFDFSRAVEDDHYHPEVMLTQPVRFSRELQVISDGEDAVAETDIECLLAIADDAESAEDRKEGLSECSDDYHIHIPALDRTSFLCVGSNSPPQGGAALLQGLSLFDGLYHEEREIHGK